MFETKQLIYVRTSTELAKQTGVFLHCPKIVDMAFSGDYDFLDGSKMREAKLIRSYTNIKSEIVETYVIPSLEGILKDVSFYTKIDTIIEKGQAQLVYIFNVSLTIKNPTIENEFCFKFSLMWDFVDGKYVTRQRLHYLYLLFSLEEYIKQNGIGKEICLQNNAKGVSTDKSGKVFPNVSFYVKNKKGEPFHKSERRFEKGTNMYDKSYFYVLSEIKTNIEAAIQAKNFEGLADTEV